ncbi:hypothetical protein SUGI_1040570 [Cryptomeria japonica]|nr:hypothetical protein SUGI_1040570 [Cryptomeria japonica]
MESTGYCQTVKNIVGGALFPEVGIENVIGCGGGSGGLVVVRNIDLFSYCEACLLPFKVRFHVAYISSGQRVVGLSKLSRVAEAFAKRLQAPQRLANEVSKMLYDTKRPLGIAVALECWHMQFHVMDGNAYEVNSDNQEMCGWNYFSVCAVSGHFEDESSDAWGEFIAVLSLGGVNIKRSCTTASAGQQGSWCPFQLLDDMRLPPVNGKTLDDSELRSNVHMVKKISGPNSQLNLNLQSKVGVSFSMMVAAVESIISAVGEDPKREELQDTPRCFVWWLLNFCLRKPGFQVNGFDWSIADSYRGGSSPLLDTVASTEAVSSGFVTEIDVPFFSQFQFFSQKLQVQERLTKQIAETVASTCNTAGDMVVLEASHICMLSRGVEKIGSSTATIAVLGRFVTDSAAKVAFFQKILSRDPKRR